jgi:hypothetical protein
MFITWDPCDKWTTWVGTKMPKWFHDTDETYGQWQGAYSDIDIPRLSGFTKPKFPTLWSVTSRGVRVLKVQRPIGTKVKVRK